MGANSKPFHYMTGQAGVDLKDHMGKGVVFSAEGVFGKPTAGQRIIGVLAQPLPVNEVGSAAIEGCILAIAGGPIGINDEVEVLADGRFIKLASGKSAGICLMANVAAGKPFTLYLK